MPILLILFVVIPLITAFICSLLEAVILSATPAYISVSVKQKQKSGLLLQELKDQVDRPLAAVLTLNTIANTVGAAGVSTQVLKLWGDEYVALASGLLTVLILVGAEIIPKTIGASHWKALAPVAAYTINAMIKITYPFVLLSEYLSRVLRKENDAQVTREEMIETAELGASEGALRKKESTIIKNLLMLGKIYVYDIMTPRSVMLAFENTMTVQEVMAQYKPLRSSRIPVYHEDLDHIEGIVHRYKILEASSNDSDTLKIKDLATPVHTIPEDVSVSACLDQFIQRQEHLFIVVSEHGTTVGLVTLEDAIETLLGVEIVDEFDSVADMRQFAIDQWKQRKKAKGKV